MTTLTKPRVAIVSLGGLFPGRPGAPASGPEQLWADVLAAADTARTVPAGRWVLDPDEAFDPQPGRPDRVYSRRGCFLADIPSDPSLPAGLDPLFALTMHVGRQAWRGAVTAPLDLRRVGVILGNIALPTDGAAALAWDILGRTLGEKIDPDFFPSAQSPQPLNRYVAGLPAGLLARGLGLGGGSVTLDAACASSLYAIQLAAAELQAGRLGAVLAGGVSRPDCLYTQMGFAQLRALSSAGRAAPFDAAGDGLVVGEGAGIFVLKRLDDALRHGDTILAVLAGAGLSNDLDGGLLAPSSEGQLRAMRAAYAAAGWRPTDVDLVECHATGTPIGDAVEFSSLRTLWEDAEPGRCVLGSVKSTVGHLLTAAGAAGLTKVLFALRDGVLPPTANFTQPAPGVALAGSPFRIVNAPETWRRRGDGIPRRAAISGFGFGGINAHLLLEEWLPQVFLPSPLGGEGSGVRGDFVYPSSRISEIASEIPSPPTPLPQGERGAGPRSLSESIDLAIVGLGAAFGPWQDLASFSGRVFGNDSRPPSSPRHWWGVDQAEWFRATGQTAEQFLGYYVDMVRLGGTRFRIPPRELAEMLPQQLLLLRVADEALTAAGHNNEPHPRTGAFVGLGLDFNTTQFHLRWALPEAARQWARRQELDTASKDFAAWVRSLCDATGPALNANRTMGAFGSIAASRVARAFRLGGPSFTVCSEDTSGLRALEMAARALQRGDLDAALVGAVDLAGDVRSVLATRAAGGSGPVGEGAAAVVLMRLADAERSGKLIYGVLRACGIATGPQADVLALNRAVEEAGLHYGSLAYRENPQSVRTDIGDSGAATGLAAVVKACLALHMQTLPPRHSQPDRPGHPARHWLRNRQDGPRRATVTASSIDGSGVAVILEEHIPTALTALPSPFQPQEALFVVKANDLSSLSRSLDGARLHAQEDPHAVDIPLGGAPFVIPHIAAPPRRGSGLAKHHPRPIPASDLAPQVTRALATLTACQEAQSAYLRLAAGIQQEFANQIAFQTSLLESHVVAGGNWIPTVAYASGSDDHRLNPSVIESSRSAGLATMPRSLDRGQCLEFAVGSIGRVLGPVFAPIDAFPTRVRLPDEPLMLVDRIITLEGEPLSLTTGRVVTEHDIQPGAWYLDGGRMPTCLAVEAGQADLFLSGFLGIDFQTRGLAVYRLLDAVVTFHGGLPGPGQVIRYDIHIDQFFRQGDTHLFRFRFVGSVNGVSLLTMTDGCAGFFGPAELAAGKGIVQTSLDRRPQKGVVPDDQAELPAQEIASFDDEQIEALRRGDLGAAFGPAFAGMTLGSGLRLPGGRLRLVHRVPHLDPTGGRFGVGLIRGEADIHADDWFLTCHFIDDQVMPGTFMYECCLHTLRIFLLRLGWVSSADSVACEPVPGAAGRLRCRGQVTASTRTVTYEVTVKERGYRPEPYALVDALMYADGKPIVECLNMSLRLTGLTREAVRATWQARHFTAENAEIAEKYISDLNGISSVISAVSAVKCLYGPETIRAFAVGKPSEAFGEPYRIFDSERVIARLPGPPYQFLDRVVEVDGEPFVMKAGAACVAEYDVPADAWYFAAERQARMPFAVLLEVALQPCGWLAAYVGSALTSPTDLSFRNLGGTATLLAPVTPGSGTLRTAVRLTRVSTSGGMIIQYYDFEVRDRYQIVYRGDTVFGFFSRTALAQQVGLRDATLYEPGAAERGHGRSFVFPRQAPFPGDQLRMMDRVDLLVADGGPQGRGLVRGVKTVVPTEWFFAAHFYQDPVWPGSLGLEAFVQLLKVFADDRWPGRGSIFVPVDGAPHQWTYRGQVLPQDREVLVQAVVTACDDSRRRLTADGLLLVDGRVIYRMVGFTVGVADDVVITQSARATGAGRAQQTS